MLVVTLLHWSLGHQVLGWVSVLRWIRDMLLWNGLRGSVLASTVVAIGFTTFSTFSGG
jgi:hypothetical protein